MAKRRRRVPPRRPGQPPNASANAAATPKTPRAPGQLGRTLAALAVVAAVGALIGVAIAFAVPSGAVFAADRQHAALLRDTGASLELAASFSDDGDPALTGDAALANALLAADHAGGIVEAQRAAKLLATTVPVVRIQPESLYGRALLQRMGFDDPQLREDLEKRADEREKNAWWLLAKSARAFDAGQRVDAVALAQRAALGAEAPAQAQLVLAKLMAARGDVGDARALCERIRRANAEHAGAFVVGAVASAIEDARDDSPEKRAIKLKHIKQRNAPRRDGPPKPGEVKRDDESALLATWRTQAEDDALDALDKIDERDQPLVALALEALALGRGDEELASTLKKRVVTLASKHAFIAARQAELSILDGDIAGADEVLSSALEKAPKDPALLLEQARAKALGALSDDEIHKRAASYPKRLAADGIALPFGRINFDFMAPSLPFVVEPEPSVSPESAFAQALRAPADKIAQKLDVAVFVHKGEAALIRGDIPAASTALAAAREKSASDPDVMFLDARIRLRQGDRGAAKDAIDAAIASAPDDPHVLLTGARLHYDNEAFIPARKTLSKLKQLGYKSPAALALDAMIEARAGDAKNAQAALAEATSIGADDVEILRANVLLLRDGKDLEAVRKAATKLYRADDLHTTDPILRAWEADAAAREGDTVRAQAVLNDVIATRPNLGDAYLLLGSIQAGTDAAAALASFAKAIEKAPGTPVAAEAARRRAALPGGAPATAPKKKRR